MLGSGKCLLCAFEWAWTAVWEIDSFDSLWTLQSIRTTEEISAGQADIHRVPAGVLQTLLLLLQPPKSWDSV